MTVLLELEPDLEARAVAQAKKHGVALPQYLHILLQQSLGGQVSGVNDPKTFSFEAFSSELLGWPVGFFDQTYGTLVADPLQRLPQPEAEAREPIA